MGNNKVVKIPRRELSVEVSAKDADVFKETIDILAQFIKDNRIDESIRNEYADKIAGIVKKGD
ncbi:hypothetical protein [Crassaminicella profunda]|uniref:hypothetical protein n=1 Tax=Crassaminicella profunda TaxID=1286698 RepID=UPI001CA6FDD0|nr:hypothetical protein [Crassaminicella profunda]QZY56707.1 hypothetical protein K7H06_07240 [Crassaminicella profunda]